MNQQNTQPKVIAYLKPWCGWSKGVRAIMDKYSLSYEDRDIGNDPQMRMEMIQRSGQELSPCVEIDGHMLADVSGEEVEAYMLAQGIVTTSDAPVNVPINSACTDEEHNAMQQGGTIKFISRDDK